MRAVAGVATEFDPPPSAVVDARIRHLLHEVVDRRPALFARDNQRSATEIPDCISISNPVHYRTSTEVGTDAGKQIGGLAAAKYMRPQQ